jgi:DnaK suppressor protein
MDQQTTQQLRERLAGEQGALRRQLRELGARADAEGIEEPDLDAGFADAGQAAAERSSLLTLVRKLRTHLVEVEGALGRIDAGTYGRCEKCREPIPEERLEALPAVRLCMNCKRATTGSGRIMGSGRR